MTTTALTALAAHGLAGARVSPFADDPMTDPEWEAFAGAAAAHGLGGLLADAVNRGVLPSTGAQGRTAAAAHLRAMSGCLTLEAALLDSLEVLRERGVEALVVHGIAACHLDYPDPTWRTFGDVDLLVRPADLTAARTALGSAGYQAILPGQPDRLVDGRFRQIELHSHVLPARWAPHVPASEVWRQPAGLSLGGRTVFVLGAEARLVAACLKARAGADRRLVAIRDVVQQVLGRTDAEAVLDVARRWQAVPGVAAAIDEGWERFGLADVVALSVWAARNNRERQAHGTPQRERTIGRRQWLVRR